jgi:hypothetical protein
MWVTNNATKTSSTSVSITPSYANTNIFCAYNVLDASVDADYVAGAGDVTGSDAELDARLFPTASGNADSTGTPSLGYVGDSDPFGYVWIYKLGVTSKGARTRPAIISGAQLYPDVW